MKIEICGERILERELRSTEKRCMYVCKRKCGEDHIPRIEGEEGLRKGREWPTSHRLEISMYFMDLVTGRLLGPWQKQFSELVETD